MSIYVDFGEFDVSNEGLSCVEINNFLDPNPEKVSNTLRDMFKITGKGYTYRKSKFKTWYNEVPVIYKFEEPLMDGTIVKAEKIQFCGDPECLGSYYGKDIMYSKGSDYIDFCKECKDLEVDIETMPVLSVICFLKTLYKNDLESICILENTLSDIIAYGKYSFYFSDFESEKILNPTYRDAVERHVMYLEEKEISQYKFIDGIGIPKDGRIKLLLGS